MLAALARGERGPLERLVAVLEQDLSDPVDRDAVISVAKFLETVQNACSWDDLPGADAVTPLLGPNVRLVWDAAEDFWAAWVADMFPPTAKSLASVEDQKLRWLLIAGNRQVAPGLYTSLADVVRYEKASS